MTRKYTYKKEAVGYEVVESHVYEHESLYFYFRLDFVNGVPDLHIVRRCRFLPLAQYAFEVNAFLTAAARIIADGGVNMVSKLPFTDVF